MASNGEKEELRLKKS